MSARGQAVPAGGAPAVPQEERVPGRPASPRVQGQPGHGPQDDRRAGDDCPPVGRCRICRAQPDVRAGIAVPYPVQVTGTEVLLEFIGEPDGTAAPRLSETRPRGAELAGLWDQLVAALRALAGLGLAHGDLSAYNVLV